MGGIRPAKLAAIRDRLEAFAAEVFASLPRADQRARGRCYLRGCCWRAGRKSIEPMAARLVRHARRVILRFDRAWPWAGALLAAFRRLPVPG